MTINEIIERLANNGNIYLQVCKVSKVNTDTLTCDVEPLNGDAEIYDCRIEASLNPSGGLYMLPKLNSHVVVGFINKNVAAVLLQTEIDKFVIKTDKTLIEIDDNHKTSTEDYEIQSNNFNVEVENYDIQASAIKNIANSIVLASKQLGTQPAVLGTNNNIVFSEILINMTSLLAGLTAFCTTQIAVCTGVLLPLKPGYDALAVAIASVGTHLATITPKVTQTLSKTVKLD